MKTAPPRDDVASPASIRRRAGVSLYRVSHETGVSEILVRLYEADRGAVRTATKRWALDRYYAKLDATDDRTSYSAAG
jgi:hypothetical protein